MPVRRTSIETYYAIRDQGLLSRMRFLVYQCLFHHGPLTAQETFKRLRLESNQSGRFTEMRDIGVIEELGERKCAVTGRNVIVWDVTDVLPLEAPSDRRPTKAEFRAAVAELRDIHRFLRKHGHPGFSDNLIRVARWMARQ